MVNNSNEHNPLDTVTASPTKEINDNATTWQLNALTEALGDLSLTVSDSLSIGRGSDNDVVLGSKQVSRNHALLSVLNGMLYIKDLQSSNGTFVNSVRIESNQSQSLKSEDTVSFASFSFQVLAAQTATTAAKPSVIDAKPAPAIDTTNASKAVPTAIASSLIAETEVSDNELSAAEAIEDLVAAVDTSVEHDKTTTTALQEQADPDILRAKQVATSQFSGTANLGQPRDLGTEGNNALDQAINNPANDGSVEKKPSGGWFIWVFITIIIIGLALWLFNMGG